MSTIFHVIDNSAIIDKVPIGILVLRQDLVVVAWNVRLEQWTGIKKDDILDKEITIYYPHIKQPKYQNRLKSIFDNGPPIVFSSQLHKYFIPCPLPDNQFRIQHTTVAPVKTPEGGILAVVAIEDVTDLTKRIADIRNLHKAALLEIEERKKIEAALKESERLFMELSITDELTKLYNSRHLFSELRNEMERSTRFGRPLSIALLDVDNFKRINDYHGHLEGDKVLINLAVILRNHTRAFDTAYRYGGEEFITVFPETALIHGVDVAERIREKFTKLVFQPMDMPPFSATISIGVVQFNGTETIDEFIARADKAMYTAKKNGKNQVCCMG